jgi:RNase P/RNase MRP subunit p30
MVIGSFSEEPFDLRSPYDITSLFSLLGMNGKIIKEHT